jgi:hypothetical protein
MFQHIARFSHTVLLQYLRTLPAHLTLIIKGGAGTELAGAYSFRTVIST